MTSQPVSPCSVRSEFVLPTYITVGKRKPKKLPLNLNHYRNAHFHVLNSMKVTFKELIQDQLKVSPFDEPIIIDYQLYVPSRREIDVSNVLCIVDKYFCDSLVEEGLLVDDNYKYLVQTQYSFGGIDKHNPRAEAQIYYADYNQPNPD